MSDSTRFLRGVVVGIIGSFVFWCFVGCAAIGVAKHFDNRPYVVSTALEDATVNEAAHYKAGYEDGYHAGVNDGAQAATRQLAIVLENGLNHAKVTEGLKRNAVDHK